MKDQSTLEESGCSIFIINLPADIAPTQVEVEFKNFGDIKPCGVQVRSMRGGRSTYAFVEFEEEASLQAAINASPLPMDARKVFVHAKRPIAGRDGY